jgi:hypothetical protein
MVAKCPDDNTTPGSNWTPFVEWKKYPAFGSPHGFVTADGIIQNPVPSSVAMAELQSEQVILQAYLLIFDAIYLQIRFVGFIGSFKNCMCPL